MQTSKESSGTDKQGLWGWWHKSQVWQDLLHRKATFKALDIEDPMSVNSYKGIGAGGLLGIAALTLAGPILGGALIMWYQSQQSEPSAPPAVSAPSDAGYEVRFYDGEGNEVRLDRWPGREL